MPPSSAVKASADAHLPRQRGHDVRTSFVLDENVLPPPGDEGQADDDQHDRREGEQGRVILAGLPPAELDAWLERVQLEPLTSFSCPSVDDLRRRIGEVADRGYDINQGEIDEGACGISVPVRDRSGAVVAALNVGGPTNRITQQNMVADILPTLLSAANRTVL